LLIYPVVAGGLHGVGFRRIDHQESVIAVGLGRTARKSSLAVAFYQAGQEIHSLEGRPAAFQRKADEVGPQQSGASALHRRRQGPRPRGKPSVGPPEKEPGISGTALSPAANVNEDD